MGYVLKAVLSSAKHPEYGQISEQPQGGGTSAGGMAQGIQAAPDSRKTVFRP